MDRRLVAFLVAPLAVPIVLGPYLYSIIPTPIWFAFALIASVIVAYGGVLIVGLPAYYLFLARKWTAFWIAPLLGFVVGGLMWFTSGAVLALLLDQGWAGVGRTFANFGGPKDVLWPFGPIGALVGSLLWIIARPDRQ
jgi:hypothetical protein